MSISRAYRTIHLALKSLMLHKLRSGLTMLGIVFGVFSVIAMLAIGEGASAQAQKQVLEHRTISDSDSLDIYTIFTLFHQCLVTSVRFFCV